MPVGFVFSLERCDRRCHAVFLRSYKIRFEMRLFCSVCIMLIQQKQADFMTGLFQKT